MSKRENGIYVTHGKEMLVGYKALVTHSSQIFAGREVERN